MKQRIRQFRVEFPSSNRRYLQRLLWRLDETTFPTEIRGLANGPSRRATYFVHDWFVNHVGRRLAFSKASPFSVVESVAEMSFFGNATYEVSIQEIGRH